MSHFLGAGKGNQWSDFCRDARGMRLRLQALIHTAASV